MGWIEDRMGRLERREEDDYRRLLDLQAQLNAVRQQLRGAYQQLPTSSSSGGGPGYFGCTLSGNLAHGSSISGQSIWKMPGRAAVTAAGVVYNDGPNADDDLTAGEQVILSPNDDGSYTATGVYC